MSGLTNIKLIKVVYICVAVTKKLVYIYFVPRLVTSNATRKIIEMTEISVDS